MKGVAAAVGLLLLTTAAMAAHVPQARIPNNSAPRGNSFPSADPVPRVHRKYAEIPFPSPRRQWIRAEAPHFIVYGSTSERVTRKVAEDLEDLAALLERSSPYFTMPSKGTRIFLFNDPVELQPYFDAVSGTTIDGSGLTLRDPAGNTMLIDATARGGEVLTPRHELVHDLLHREHGALPLWIEEGLAEYYSNAGQPIREHVSRVRNYVRVPMTELMAARAGSSSSSTYDFYAESWAAVAVLMRRDAAAFFPFVHDIDVGMDQRTALATRYHLTPAALAGLLRQSGAPARNLLPKVTSVKVTMSAVERGELLAQLAEMLSHAGQHKEAERHYRAATEVARASKPKTE